MLVGDCLSSVYMHVSGHVHVWQCIQTHNAPVSVSIFFIWAITNFSVLFRKSSIVYCSTLTCTCFIQCLWDLPLLHWIGNFYKVTVFCDEDLVYLLLLLSSTLYVKECILLLFTKLKQEWAGASLRILHEIFQMFTNHTYTCSALLKLHNWIFLYSI